MTSDAKASDSRARTSRGTSGRPQAKSLDDPDEELAFPKGSARTVRVGDLVVGRLEQQPGWRWSEQVKPIAGTASCQFHHIGVGISGSAMIRMDDGTEVLIKAGDVFDIPPGHDQWVVGDEPAVSIIWGGWRGWGKQPVGERILTTMLFTDIASSTELASRIGDTAWDQLLERHNGRVREVLERHRGVEMDTTGDGFLAIFDGAARAVIAAAEIVEKVRDLGVEIRAAVHTGEVEVVPGNIRGLAVHEAARILALAQASEVLVSSTTRELASGPDLEYEDRGLHKLKGVPLERRVFALRIEAVERSGQG
jgi:class 3 adenylate cyclase